MKISATKTEEEKLFIAADRELGLRGTYIDFVKMAWPVVRPGITFQGNWHIDVIGEHLEAVATGQIRKLGMNVPPGCMKSLLTDVFLQPWEWIHRPHTKFFSVSFDAQLTLRDAKDNLQILLSDWFQDRWGDLCPMPSDPAASNFANLAGGWKFSTSIEGKITGRHCDICVIDDPLKPLAISKVTLATAKRWWSGTLPTRFADPKTGRRIMIMQRLHEDDLSGEAMREEGWEWLRLPMRFEKKACSYTKVGGDMRTEDGELLWPSRFGEPEVRSIERDLGPREAAAQLQQRPAPAEGAIFKQSWFKHFKEPPARFDQIIQSWDCAFKDTDGSDYVCGTVWGVIGGEYYLLDMEWARMGLPETCAAVERLTRKWPKAITKLVEDKANGPAVVQTLRKKISGMMEVTPEGGKEARANAVAPLYAAGNVWHPDPTICPWVDDYEVEMTTFPMAKNDDRVDSTTQALNYLYAKTTNYKKAMLNAKSFFS